MKYNLIKSTNVDIGVGCNIHESVEILEGANVKIGDHCYIGPGVKILPGDFSIGDYSKIHDRVNINPKSFVDLGHLSWIGQGCILDGTGGLKVGNFLGAGINTCLYSHIRHGDITEGCRFDNNQSLIIGDDVWFVGMCLVSPVNIGSKSLAFLGSTIVKDMEPNHVYGGNPAIDLTEKVGSPWQSISSEEKYNKVLSLLNKYAEDNEGFERDAIVIVENSDGILNDGRTYYDVNSRMFTKNNNPSEIAFNKWMFGYRAKFSPLQ